MEFLLKNHCIVWSVPWSRSTKKVAAYFHVVFFQCLHILLEIFSVNNDCKFICPNIPAMRKSSRFSNHKTTSEFMQSKSRTSTRWINNNNNFRPSMDFFLFFCLRTFRTSERCWAEAQKVFLLVQNKNLFCCNVEILFIMEKYCLSASYIYWIYWKWREKSNVYWWFGKQFSKVCLRFHLWVTREKQQKRWKTKIPYFHHCDVVYVCMFSVYQKGRFYRTRSCFRLHSIIKFSSDSHHLTSPPPLPRFEGEIETEFDEKTHFVGLNFNSKDAWEWVSENR